MEPSAATAREMREKGAIEKVGMSATAVAVASAKEGKRRKVRSEGGKKERGKG